jgi:hypothetical protein
MLAFAASPVFCRILPLPVCLELLHCVMGIKCLARQGIYGSLAVFLLSNRLQSLFIDLSLDT